MATIKIAQQDVSTKERVKFCEDLSFNPWHSTKSHRPLGNVNKIRKSIYKAISNMRRIKNLGSIPAEPTFDELKDF